MAVADTAPSAKVPQDSSRDGGKNSSGNPLPTMKSSVGADVTAGFLVFLIALPLCLGIAKASGFPPIAGVMTAIFGGLISGLFSNSELTIKGPAAGMIAIVLGAMTDFGYTGADPSGDLSAYKLVLAVGVIAGAAQILFGLVRAGVLCEFFPLAPVHGLLASIGLIIIAKQIHPVLGVASPKFGPVGCYAKIPDSIMHMDVKVASIGLLSLAIMFLYPVLKTRLKFIGKVPAQLLVLLVAIPMGQALHLPADKLISLPEHLSDAIVTPDFSQVFGGTSLKWILMFALVGTLESMLSAKAIDLLDPWKRKTDMNRDVLGVGVANTAVAAVGGLPMISEILRSSANISNGARTRTSNAAHGAFLLLALVFLAPLVKLIPLAALGAMLVFAGFRLASPKEFLHMWKSGVGQFLVFCLTIAFIIPEGHLLDGIFVGVVAELLLNIFAGASLTTLFKPHIDVRREYGDLRLNVDGSLTFTNWIPFLRTLRKADVAREGRVIVDLTHAQTVDRTARDKLTALERDFSVEGRELQIVGLATAAAH
ncbi:MAG: SulP family inorganic anion transporter [Pirellulales bacterium]